MTPENARRLLALCDIAAIELIKHNAQIPEWHRLVNAFRGRGKAMAIGLVA